jgi:hypothetical protein
MAKFIDLEITLNNILDRPLKFKGKELEDSGLGFIVIEPVIGLYGKVYQKQLYRVTHLSTKLSIGPDITSKSKVIDFIQKLSLITDWKNFDQGNPKSYILNDGRRLGEAVS